MLKNKLKEYREKEGFTQEQLSQKSGISRNTISLIENNSELNVTYNVMKKLADTLGKKVQTIFFTK